METVKYCNKNKHKKSDLISKGNSYLFNFPLENVYITLH